jgi:hypothetical protein
MNGRWLGRWLITTLEDLHCVFNICQTGGIGNPCSARRVCLPFKDYHVETRRATENSSLAINEFIRSEPRASPLTKIITEKCRYLYICAQQGTRLDLEN